MTAITTPRVFTWPDASPVIDANIIAAARAELAHWDDEIEALCVRFGYDKQGARL